MVRLNWFVRQKVLGANIHETEGLFERNIAQLTQMYVHGVREGGGPLVLARRGAPVSTSTAVLWADLFYQAGRVTGIVTVCI